MSPSNLCFFVVLAISLETTRAQNPKCSDIYTKNGLTPPPESLVLPTDLVTIGRKYSNGKALPGWSGPFDSIRGGTRIKGITINYIADTYLYQEAQVQEMGGSPVQLTTTITYCPLNITKRASSLVIAGVNAERYDIWWTVSDTQNGIIKREQCMALARLPNNGTAISMSFQLNDGLTCPNDPVFPVPSGASFATYTYALVYVASSAQSPTSSIITSFVVLILSVALSIMTLYGRLFNE